jgi:hypothetical protein
LLCCHGSRVAILAWWTSNVLGEFDVELDVEVAVIVVAVGWHTLAADDFDFAY